MRSFFPDADRFGDLEGTPPAASIYSKDTLLGYAFLTGDMVRIPAYSGRPINVLVGIDIGGRITGARIVHHEEPILAAGVSEEKLAQYVDQYRGKPTNGHIIVGGQREGYAVIDAISGATITVMVLNATITRAVRMVADSRGIKAAGISEVQIREPAPAPAAKTRPDKKTQEKSAKRPESAPAKPASQAARPSTPPVGSLAPAIPEPPEAAPGIDEPMWLLLWQQRKPEIAILLLGLTVLSGILLFHDFLARRPQLLRRVRLGFLLYTLFFIGWYALGQLSIINVLTFVQAVMHQFSWDTFLIDPMLFLLWSFVAVALLLWGRGVYCGWLCPFGALQELTYKLARIIRLPSFDMPNVVHERLLALKFVIMLALFGASLQSMTWAIKAAEIEPFKTAITLRFQREWIYVLIALGIIAITAFNRKFYCKYICPLGAALIIPGRFHSFEWLRRRKECGKPCQTCASECEVQAIKPTGEIVVNECHYCLDCQVTFYDNKKCPPLVERRKRRERLGRNPETGGASEKPELAQQATPIKLNPANSDGETGVSPNPDSG